MKKQSSKTTKYQKQDGKINIALINSFYENVFQQFVL